MNHLNCTRSGCKDVFHAFLVKNAQFETRLEIPALKRENIIPNRIIPFSKSIKSTDYECFVHFYEDDALFERIWNHPYKYLPILKKFKGVITPDFSLYRDMPLVMQLWNIYRSRAIGAWLQDNGIIVLPNVRWGDERTFEFSCAGVPKSNTIVIGSHGCIKHSIDRGIFIRGLDYAMRNLTPKTVIVYGAAPEEIFGKYRKAGIRVIVFDSEIKMAHQKAVTE